MSVMDSEVTIDRIIGGLELPLSELLQSDHHQCLEVFDDDKHSSGKVFFDWKITKQFIIFRNKKMTGEIEEDNEFILFHEDNESTKKGIKIVEAVPYPINEDFLIKIQYKEEKQSFTLLEMKQKANKGLVFRQDFASLTYDVYD